MYKIINYIKLLLAECAWGILGVLLCHDAVLIFKLVKLNAVTSRTVGCLTNYATSQHDYFHTVDKITPQMLIIIAAFKNTSKASHFLMEDAYSSCLEQSLIWL